MSDVLLPYQPAAVVDIYCRVSTDPQEANTSLDEQEQTGRAYCQAHGLIVGLVHREKYSGFYYRERTKLSLMRERYLSGKIQGVVIRTFDRLSRKEVHFGILLEEMEHNGVVLHCIKEQLEDTLMGKMTRMFLSMLAEWEREKITDRVMTGRANMAKSGKVVSGWKLPYGYTWKLNALGEKETIMLHPEQSETVQWLAEAYADGASADALRDQLAEKKILSPMGKEFWFTSVILRVISDPRITGKNAQQFLVKDKRAETHIETVAMPDGTYPEIISEELFARIQQRRENNKQDASKRGQTPELFLLRAGFVKCECGLVMSGCTFKMSRAHGKVMYRYSCNGEHKHPQYQVRSEELDALVWQECEQFAEHLELIQKAIELATSSQTIESDAKSIRASLVTWQQRAANYEEDLQDISLRGDSRASIRRSLNEANEMVEKLEGELAQVQGGMVDQQLLENAYQRILTWCRQVKEKRNPLTYTEKRDFLRLLGVQVIVRGANKKKEPMNYHIELTLPEIRALFPAQNKAIVTQDYLIPHYKTRGFVSIDQEHGWQIHPAIFPEHLTV